MEQFSQNMAFNQATSESFEFFANYLYAKPKQSIMRELMANAISASKLLHKDQQKPIKVFINNEHIAVQDWGIGMSLEDIITVFSVYLASTKKDDPNQIGGFGIGAKSIFAYSDHFVMETTSHEDGIRRTFLFEKKEQEAPTYTMIKQEASSEKGTRIQFPLQLIQDKVDFLNGCSQMAFMNYPIELVHDLNYDFPIQNHDMLKNLQEDRIAILFDRQVKNKEWGMNEDFVDNRNTLNLQVVLGGINYPFSFVNTKYNEPFKKMSYQKDILKCLNILHRIQGLLDTKNNKLNDDNILYQIFLDMPNDSLTVNSSRESIIDIPHNHHLILDSLNSSLENLVEKQIQKTEESLAEFAASPKTHFFTLAKQLYLISRCLKTVRYNNNKQMQSKLENLISKVTNLLDNIKQEPFILIQAKGTERIMNYVLNGQNSTSLSSFLHLTPTHESISTMIDDNYYRWFNQWEMKCTFIRVKDFSTINVKHLIKMIKEIKNNSPRYSVLFLLSKTEQEADFDYGHYCAKMNSRSKPKKHQNKTLMLKQSLDSNLWLPNEAPEEPFEALLWDYIHTKKTSKNKVHVLEKWVKTQNTSIDFSYLINDYNVISLAEYKEKIANQEILPFSKQIACQQIGGFVKTLMDYVSGKNNQFLKNMIQIITYTNQSNHLIISEAADYFEQKFGQEIQEQIQSFLDLTIHFPENNHQKTDYSNLGLFLWHESNLQRLSLESISETYFDISYLNKFNLLSKWFTTRVKEEKLEENSLVINDGLYNYENNFWNNVYAFAYRKKFHKS